MADDQNGVHARLKILEQNQEKMFGRLDSGEHRISVVETEVGHMKNSDTVALTEIKEIRDEVNKLRRVIAWASGAIAVLIGMPTLVWTIIKIFE